MMICDFKLMANISDNTITINTISDLCVLGSFPTFDIYRKNGLRIAHIFFYLNGGDYKYLDIEINYNDEIINIINIIDADNPENISEYKTKLVNVLLGGGRFIVYTTNPYNIR